ncbi:TPA: BppU family phage baseplate upper protein [Clostridium perfringens]
MSEIGLNINVDSYNNEGIKTIKGNNNAEIYKLYILKNKRRLSLVGKTVKLGYVMVGTTNGDVIENLNITNAEQGEITFPITNRISKKDGVYSCQLAIYGADGFLEHTATFGLTVEANIFTKIAGEIADSKDFTYLERILEEAKTVSGELKETVDSVKELQCNIEIFKEANTLVKDLNDNTLNANNANSKLIENTSKAESVNVNLDSKNIEANKKIEKLEELNHKAEELNSSISNSLTSELVENIKEANNANTNLLATNQEATTKSVELNRSLEEAKKYIEGLNGSQNIPQIRMELTELQGLKNNQFLAYKGASIDASNTLVGRTEGMVINGKTSIVDGKLESFGEKEKVGDKYKISVVSHGKNLVKKNNFTNDEIKKWNGTDENYYVETIVGGLKRGTLWGYIESTGDIRYELSFGNSPIITTNQESIANTREKVIQYINSSARNTLDKDYKYAVISVRKLSQSASISKVMISNIETSYEPYKENKKDILIKEPLRENDVLYEDNGQVKVYRDVKQYTFTGDESWIKSGLSDNSYSIFYINGYKPKGKIICNNFSYIDLERDKKEGICIIGDGSLRICINNNKLSSNTVEGFKTWLKANLTTIVYQRATPVTEIVENCVDIDLDTFGEKTYFSIENSIKGTLDFKVPSNIASIVQNTAREVNNIWDVINNLLVPSIVKANGNIAMIKLNNNLK